MLFPGYGTPWLQVRVPRASEGCAAGYGGDHLELTEWFLHPELDLRMELGSQGGGECAQEAAPPGEVP